VNVLMQNTVQKLQIHSYSYFCLLCLIAVMLLLRIVYGTKFFFTQLYSVMHNDVIMYQYIAKYFTGCRPSIKRIETIFVNFLTTIL